jgi:hypothetical protein
MNELIGKIVSNPKVMAKVIPPSAVNAAVHTVGRALVKIILKC